MSCDSTVKDTAEVLNGACKRPTLLCSVLMPSKKTKEKKKKNSENYLKLSIFLSHYFCVAFWRNFKWLLRMCEVRQVREFIIRIICCAFHIQFSVFGCNSADDCREREEGNERRPALTCMHVLRVHKIRVQILNHLAWQELIYSTLLNDLWACR